MAGDELDLIRKQGKKVAFRAPLTEDIKTTRFTLAHSDIEDSVPAISTVELAPPLEVDDSSSANAVEANPTAIVVTSTKTGEKRESSDEEDSDTGAAATPIAGRRKKHRQWCWTLGPIEGTDAVAREVHVDAEDGQNTILTDTNS